MGSFPKHSGAHWKRSHSQIFLEQQFPNYYGFRTLSWQLQVPPANPGFSVGKGTLSYLLVKQVTENLI